MDDRARALGFLHAVDLAAAQHVETVAPGLVAVRHDGTPLLWDANHLVVAEPDGLSARELSHAAERLRREAGLGHRMVVVPDEAEARRLRRGFARQGWDLERHLVMALRRPPDRAPTAADVRALPFEALDGSRAEFLRTEPWGRSEDVVRQVLHRDRQLARAAQDRGFAAFQGDHAVAFCRLLADSDTAVGQVEDVATLPRHRGHGLARAVVSAAVRASRDAGHRLTFITADADDWPQVLYRRMGFDDLTVIHRFRIVVAG